MKAAIVFMSTLLALFSFGAPQAGMAVTCMDRDEMESALIDWYGAQKAAQSPVQGLEYWVSADSGAWALVQPRGETVACVLARGLAPPSRLQLIALRRGTAQAAG